MAENCFTRRPLTILAEESVLEIHGCAMSLLEQLGIRIDSQEALQLLGDYGVHCDRNAMRAYPNNDCVQEGARHGAKAVRAPRAI